MGKCYDSTLNKAASALFSRRLQCIVSFDALYITYMVEKASLSKYVVYFTYHYITGGFK
jgi:hypothetical protein